MIFSNLGGDGGLSVKSKFGGGRTGSGGVRIVPEKRGATEKKKLESKTAGEKKTAS